MQNYLKSVRLQFQYYRKLGDRSLAQLNDEQLFWTSNANDNSIGVMVKHLWGNMLSRWTDFLTTDGEKEWRQRDAEFEADIKDRQELLAKWNEGWDCLFTALDSINEGNFDSVVYIRNQGHSIVEAVNRQLAHYAYHVGQIVFLAKMMQGEDWQSLSIAKGASKDYNAEKFAQEKRQEHFTKEFLDDSESS